MLTDTLLVRSTLSKLKEEECLAIALHTQTNFYTIVYMNGGSMYMLF